MQLCTNFYKGEMAVWSTSPKVSTGMPVKIL